MLTAKVFENGRSQAVRIPKEYRFHDEEVYVNKVGEVVMLIPKKDKWSGLLASLDMFPEDVFTEERVQGIQEERESF